MVDELSSAIPARRGHFRLESGYHADRWLDLDGLFVETARVAPLVGALADRLRRYEVSAICGPLLGGAFLAQALATRLGVSFLYAVPGETRASAGLFGAAYGLPPVLRERVEGWSVAVVDDAISAGSSVRATVAALEEAGASVAVVAALLVLGDRARSHFASRDIPFEGLEESDFVLWHPDECPLCREGVPLQDPGAASAGPSPRELVEEFYSDIWNRHDRSRIPRLLAKDFAFRGSLGPTSVGREAFASYVDRIHQALEDYRCDILELVVERDRAFARMRFSGLHRGELLGHPPTGSLVHWEGAARFTFRDGVIADLWVLGDVHGLLRQLAGKRED